MAVEAKLIAPLDTALQFDNAAAPILYLGEAPPGTATSAPHWRICKIDVTSGAVITWANGDDTYKNVWDDRAGLSYS